MARKFKYFDVARFAPKWDFWREISKFCLIIRSQFTKMWPFNWFSYSVIYWQKITFYQTFHTLTLISRKLNDDCCRQDLERKAHWRSRQKCFYPGELKVSKSVAMAAIIKQEWRKLSFFGASRIQQGFLKRIQSYLTNQLL